MSPLDGLGGLASAAHLAGQVIESPTMDLV